MNKLWQGLRKRPGGDTLLGNNVKYYVLNGIVYTIVTNLYKPFAQKFIYRLGGNDFHVSLYNALPGMVAVFVVIPGLLMVSRSVSKKNMTSVFFLLSRLFILSFALVPFFPKPLWPIAFVMLSGFMNFPESVSQTALQGFTADAFAEKDRAYAISIRNKYSALISFVSLLALGQIIEVFGTTDARVLEIYQLFFVAAFLLGIYEIATFLKMKEINTQKSEKINLGHTLAEVFRNKSFMGFLSCSLLFHFGWQMGWPLFSIYQINVLGADEAWLTISGVTSGIAMFVCYGYWERLINRKGNPYAIAVATTGMAATPIMYAFSPNLYILTIAGIIMGFFTAGTTTGVLSSLLEAAPEKNRMIYVGVHATLTNVTLSIAPLIGDFTLSHSNIFIALYICAAVRFLGSSAFFLRDRRKRGIVKQVTKSA